MRIPIIFMHTANPLTLFKKLFALSNWSRNFIQKSYALFRLFAWNCPIGYMRGAKKNVQDVKPGIQNLG